MVRLFSHWFPSTTIMQVAFDATLLFFAFLIGGVWLTRGDFASSELLPSALLFAVAMIVLHSTVGLYRRDPYRTRMQTAARFGVFIVLAVPVAYFVFRLLPWGHDHQEVLNVTAISALAVLIGVRGLVAQRKSSPMFVRRVLVFGTGPEAASVEQSLGNFGPGMSIVGFYPVLSDDTTHAIAMERV